MKLARYVNSFLFCGTMLALVRKKKPDWQRGRLNGIGGKIEPGELEIKAAIRELTEEVQIKLSSTQLIRFCDLYGGDWEMPCYSAMLTPEQFDKLPHTNDASEEVVKRRIWDIYKQPQHYIPNLSWLIPMAYTAIFHPDRYLIRETHMLGSSQVGMGDGQVVEEVQGG